MGAHVLNHPPTWQVQKLAADDGASGTFAAAEFDGVLAAVNVTVGLNPTASGSVVRFSIALGETSIFDEATEQIFLLFFFQFISGGRSGGGGPDPDDEEDENGEDTESGTGEPGDIVNPGGDDDEDE